MKYKFNERDPWKALSKIASAVSGRPIQVLPGSVPSVSCTPPSTELNTIQIRSETLVPSKEAKLSVDMSHEMSHLLLSVLTGQAMLGPRLLQNCLEDARIGQAHINTWSGLTSLLQEGLHRLTSYYALRERRLASSQDVLKVYYIAVCLNLALGDLEWNEIRRKIRVDPMALETAKELFPLAAPAMRATSTHEVADIATEIFKEIVTAAAKAATRLDTPASRLWSRQLRKEVTVAGATPYEQVFTQLEKRTYPGFWQGPWSRGSYGGYSFLPQFIEWDSCEPMGLSLPNQQTIQAILMNSDPLIEHKCVQSNRLQGNFHATSDLILRATIGGDRRLFEKSSSDYSLMLLPLLGSLEVLVFLDGHFHYHDSEWLEAKQIAGTMGRLLQLAKCPVSVIRAYQATRPKETVEEVNPRTGAKRTFERLSMNIEITIAEIKELSEKWNDVCETRLASLPKDGFNLPAEGYPKLLTYKIDLPKQTTRKRIILCIGNAKEINVPLYGSHVKEATSALRNSGSKTIFAHCGPVLHNHDPYRKALTAGFDRIIREHSFEQQMVGILRAIIELSA